MTFMQKIRYFSVVLLYLCANVLLVYNLWNLVVNKRDFLLEQSKLRVERKRVISVKRKKILDRNGEVLAMSLPKTSFWVRPERLLNDPSQKDRLAVILGKSSKHFTSLLEKNRKRHFMYVLRYADQPMAQKITDAYFQDVVPLVEYTRMYPGEKSLAQLIGFTDVDGRGQEGVELAMNDKLVGKNGYQRVVIDRYGHAVETLSASEEKMGHDIILTIDKDLQHHVFAALKQGVLQSKARSGMAIVVDVASNEVLAAANYPSFNPNDSSDRHSYLKNRVFTDIQEPGSTFKPIAMGFILDHSRVGLKDMWDTAPGIIHVNGNQIEDVHNYGVLSTEEVMVKSSNIGMAKMIWQTKNDFQVWIDKKLGVKQKVGLGFPGESAGQLSVVREGDLFSLATLSFGYGVSFSTARLAQYYVAIANGGLLKPLTLYRAKSSKDRWVQIFTPETAQAIKKMMHRSVSIRGTGSLSTKWGGAVAGKTGTAYMHIPGKGYDKNRYMASFAGFSPVDKPKYVVVVVIEDPDKKRHFGGQVAAPVFSNIMFNAMYLTKGLQNSVG